MISARTGELARIGIALRWRLIHNQGTRSGRKRRVWPGRLFSGGYALANIVGLAAARTLDDKGAAQTAVILVSSLAFGWIFGPVLTGGVDETVDPTRLALLPLRRNELFTVQIAAALSGTGPLAALVGLSIGLPLAFASLDTALPVMLLAGPVAVVGVLGMGRVAAALLAVAQRSRAGRDLAVLAASLIAGAFFVAAQLGGRFTDARGERILSWLAWAPWCWPARAAAAGRVGDSPAAWGWFTASLLWCAAALAIWARLSMFLLVHGERSVGAARRDRRSALLRARTPFGATLARQWLYLRRSPNTRVSFVFGIAFGVSFSVVQIIQRGGADHPLAPFAALLAMVANLGATSNLLGFDAGSLWMEVATGGPGRIHIAARSLMALPNLLIPTWISALVVGAWTGQWQTLGMVVAIAVPVALLALSVGIVTSVLAGWPVPDGDNPFANRQAAHGRQARLALVGLGGMFGTGLLAAPVVAFAYLGREASWAPLVPAAATLVTLATGGAVLAWAGRRLGGSEPELLERLSPIALN